VQTVPLISTRCLAFGLGSRASALTFSFSLASYFTHWSWPLFKDAKGSDMRPAEPGRAAPYRPGLIKFDANWSEFDILHPVVGGMLCIGQNALAISTTTAQGPV